MNILFLCHRFPFPPNRGGKIRPFNMIRHLSRQHTVVVGTLAHSRAEVEEGAGLKDHCSEIIAEIVPSARRWVHAVAALPTLIPSSQQYFQSARLERRIRELPSRFQIDAVIVHCAFVAHYARSIAAPFRMLDLGDLDSRKWADYSKYRSFPLSAGYALEAFKLHRVEKRLAEQFDQCTVTAQGELESYKELGAETPCTVIPNGVDANYFSSPAVRQPNSRTIVFLGRMDYYPNVAGILDFVKTVFPLIRRAVPDAHMRIVGSNPLPEIKELEKLGGISVTGFVPDVRPHVRDAAVAIAPIRIARGTQNKVLECMALRIPVVATPQVAKGVQAVPERHLLVGDAPGEFADQVIRLLSNHELRARVADGARTEVVAAHSWDQSMKLLDRVIEAGATTNTPIPDGTRYEQTV